MIFDPSELSNLPLVPMVVAGTFCNWNVTLQIWNCEGLSQTHKDLNATF
jgi:formate/nitrite transporter FocA (FNT family)